MGVSASTNISQSTQNVLTSVVEGIVNSCGQSAGQNQVVDLNISNSKNIVIDVLDLSQNLVTNTSCVFQNAQNSNITTQMQSVADQMAKAASGLGLDAAASTNVAKQFQNLASSISSQITNECKSNIDQEIRSAINVSNDENVEFKLIKLNQMGNALLNCVSNNSQIDSISNAIASEITQKAKATAGITGGVLIIILVIIAIIIIIYLFKSGGSSGRGGGIPPIPP